MKSIDDIKKEARSQSMTKWIGIIEEELDLEAEGDSPTKKMRHLIQQLQEITNDTETAEELEKFIKRLVITWYKIGARRGAAELVNLLYEKEILKDEIYEKLPEKIKWKKGLTYKSLDGKRKRIRLKKYAVEF